MSDDRQEWLDRFYFAHGPSCAGCDWWRSIGIHAGECLKSAPVSPDERYAMLGMVGCSLPLSAGHVLTRHDHHCGDFKDEFDWPSLPLGYLKRVGFPSPPSTIDRR